MCGVSRMSAFSRRESGELSEKRFLYGKISKNKTLNENSGLPFGIEMGENTPSQNRGVDASVFF